MSIRQGGVFFRFLITGIFVVGFCFCVASKARAHGFGLHVAGGAGENAHAQIGLSWDTAVAEDRLFNYRMNLGYEKFKLENHWGDTDKFSGLILENTFGFRLHADENMRLWTGPQVVTGLYDNDFAIGLGFSLGANWHLADQKSVAVTIGVRRSEYSGILDYSEYETVGYLRLEFFLRTGRDRFYKPASN